MTQRQEQRRSKRYRQDLVVELHDRNGSRVLHALDVARHGMFIQTDEPPRTRHLVQLTIHLPTGPIAAAATVSRAITEATKAGGPGVGVQFFALSSEAKQRWDEYIAALAQQESQRTRGAPREVVPGLPGQAPLQPELAGSATFLVKLKSLERLKDFHLQHVQAGGTVLFTPVLREIGDSVVLVVVHPVSDEEFPLPGVVAAVHANRPKRLEIHFGLRTPEGLSAFERFVSTGKPPAVPPVVSASLPDLVAERLIGRDPLPWEPRALNAPAGAELDFDVDVFAENSVDDDDPIDWERGGIDVDFSLDEASLRGPHLQPAPHRAAAAPPVEAASADDEADAPLGQGEVEIEVEDGADAVLDTDTGMRPSTFLLTCDTCDADPYPVEVGPLPGLLGLVADLVPLWCGACGKVAAAERTCAAYDREQRMQSLLKRNWKADQLRVPLPFALRVAALAEPATCPDCAGELRATKTVEKLAALLESLDGDAGRVKTKVRCGKCEKGVLLAAPFRIG